MRQEEMARFGGSWYRAGMVFLSILVWLTLPIWGGFVLMALSGWEIKERWNYHGRDVLTGKRFILNM